MGNQNTQPPKYQHPSVEMGTWMKKSIFSGGDTNGQ
jgi:hypothetical protein